MVKEKNWLIRTTNYQILGPVSKEKIIEFVNKGSLKGEDEVSSGNGYWFLIKEKDLLEKYIFGDIPQTFNPITEAPNILTANHSADQTGTHNKITRPVAAPKVDPSGDGALPDDGDLEYPDMNLPASDDLEYPDMAAPSGEMNIDNIQTSPAPSVSPGMAKPTATPLAEDEIEGLLPDEQDLEYPDLSEFGLSDPEEDIILDEFEEGTSPTNPAISEFDEETDPGIAPPDPTQEIEIPEEVISAAPARPAPKAARITPTAKANPAPAPKRKTVQRKKATGAKPKQRNDKLLFLLTSIFFVTFLFAAVIFYYKKVLNKPLPFIGQTIINTVLPTASAQVGQSESLVKKKVFLILKK
ncbi:MAG: hypothetical protein CME70_00695 [Halobacteriovorax sp.]|nr:hypothetical protein [Halobacteriovorax sp.]|tara:strand:+ start:84709 stop:85773 length:1065 start_codon:yes stop_codon:yes gene_type:complete